MRDPNIENSIKGSRPATVVKENLSCGSDQ